MNNFYKSLNNWMNGQMIDWIVEYMIESANEWINK